MSGKHRVRRPLVRAGVVVVGIGVVAVVVAAALGGRSPDGRPAASGTPSRPPQLALLVVRSDAGPLLAVVAAGAGTRPAAMVVPATVALTIPGQGDGRVQDAVGLPGPEAAVAISNLLGVWIPHVAITDTSRLAAVIDRAGGVEVFRKVQSGVELRRTLDKRGPARALTWRELLAGLLAAAPSWSSGDFLEADDAGAVALLLQDAKGADVMGMPVVRAASGFLRPDEPKLTEAVAARLGGPSTTPVPVIVLNGSGAPGVGQSVAVQLVPAGFRVTVSENASSFDHETTLVVAGTAADRSAADRVRELLGVGTVSVAGVPSGLGAVTIVVGTDYQTG